MQSESQTYTQSYCSTNHYEQRHNTALTIFAIVETVGASLWSPNHHCKEMSHAGPHGKPLSNHHKLGFSCKPSLHHHTLGLLCKSSEHHHMLGFLCKSSERHHMLGPSHEPSLHHHILELFPQAVSAPSRAGTSS